MSLPLKQSEAQMIAQFRFKPWEPYRTIPGGYLELLPLGPEILLFGHFLNSIDSEKDERLKELRAQPLAQLLQSALSPLIEIKSRCQSGDPDAAGMFLDLTYIIVSSFEELSKSKCFDQFAPLWPVWPALVSRLPKALESIKKDLENIELGKNYLFRSSKEGRADPGGDIKAFAMRLIYSMRNFRTAVVERKLADADLPVAYRGVGDLPTYTKQTANRWWKRGMKIAEAESPGFPDRLRPESERCETRKSKGRNDFDIKDALKTAFKSLAPTA